SGKKLAEKTARKPRSARGRWAVATSIIVSAPPTNGSRTRPTLGSSKTHMPSHLYGLMTKRLFFMVILLAAFYARCPASRAALRRPSVLLVIGQRERCFRLAEARPRALPFPGAEVDAPDDDGPAGILPAGPFPFLSEKRRGLTLDRADSAVYAARWRGSG